MLSVGRFAELAGVSTRTVRFYETIGLLPKPARQENNYRYYDQKWLEQMNRIRDLQSLGFSLEDVRTIISFSAPDLNERLKIRLLELGQEIESRYSKVTDSTMAYLNREAWLGKHPQTKEFISAVQKCVEFAKEKNLALGTARGSAPASLTLFGLGLSGIDPMKYEMIPERLTTQTPFFHIDVVFTRPSAKLLITMPLMIIQISCSAIFVRLTSKKYFSSIFRKMRWS